MPQVHSGALAVNLRGIVRFHCEEAKIIVTGYGCLQHPRDHYRTFLGASGLPSDRFGMRSTKACLSRITSIRGESTCEMCFALRIVTSRDSAWPRLNWSLSCPCWQPSLRYHRDTILYYHRSAFRHWCYHIRHVLMNIYGTLRVVECSSSSDRSLNVLSASPSLNLIVVFFVFRGSRAGTSR